VGGDAAANAQVVRDVVGGRTGPVRDIVVLNAAAALVAEAGPQSDRLESDLLEQTERAREAIDSGAAASVLDRWVDATRRARGAATTSK
jgi:anthranilate phosphoribosyltransferase